MFDIQTADYEELKIARQQINTRIQELERAAVAELEARAKQFGFTLNKNGHFQPANKPKYSDGNGNSWTGKGKRPAWLQQKLDEGHSLEDLMA